MSYLNENKPKTTPSIDVFGIKFCAYCLQPMKHASGYDDYYPWDVDYCDCDKACEHVSIEDAISKEKETLNTLVGKGYSPAWRQDDKTYKRWLAKKKLEIIQGEINLLESLDDK